MSLERRTHLVHLARKHNALVISDDVYDALQWSLLTEPGHGNGAAAPEVLPRLCDIDLALEPSPDDPCHFGNTVSNGSFSKIVAPGMRTGWTEATPKFTYALSQTGSTRSGGSPSQFGATLMWKLLKSGDLDAHLETVIIPGLQRRHRQLLRSIREHLIPLGLTLDDANHAAGSSQYGGYFVWLTLPSNLDSEAIASRAEREENLTIGHGKMFEVRGDEDSALFRNHIRLSFSWEPEEALAEGIQRLGNIVRSQLEQSMTCIPSQ